MKAGLFLAAMGDEPGMQGRGLCCAGLKCEDIGMGQVETFGIEIIGQIGRLSIERDQFRFVTGLMRRDHAGIESVHSAAFACPRWAMMRPATQS